MSVKKYLYLLLAVLFLASTAVSTCNAAEKISEDTVKFFDPSWETSKGTLIFGATMQNLSNRDLQSVVVNCIFLDANHVKIGTGAATLYDVPKGKIIKFTFAPSVPDKTADAYITTVDVYAKK